MSGPMCASTVTLLLKPKVRDSQLGRTTLPTRWRELPSGSPGIELRGPAPLPGLPSGRATGCRENRPGTASWTPRSPSSCTLACSCPCDTLMHSSWFRFYLIPPPPSFCMSFQPFVHQSGEWQHPRLSLPLLPSEIHSTLSYLPYLHVTPHARVCPLQSPDQAPAS